MKLSVLKQLCCPSVDATSSTLKMCKGQLTLSEHSMEIIYGHSDGEVLQGMLRCTACGALYPVVAGVAIVVPDLRGYLQKNLSSIIQVVNSVIRESKCITPSMIHFLSALNGRNACEWTQDECLDVYLQAHFGNITPETSPLNTAVANYAGGNFYDQQFQHLNHELCHTKKALDLGCGVGGMTWRMASIFHNVIGIDMSFSSIFHARRVLLHEPVSLKSVALETEPGEFNQSVTFDYLRSDNTEFLVASALTLPCPDGWADCITSINLIDVLPNPALHIAEAARMLHPEGLFHLCDPLCWEPSVLREIIENHGSPVSYLRTILDNENLSVFESYDAPWTLRINDRQANLYLCHCLAARKR